MQWSLCKNVESSFILAILYTVKNDTGHLDSIRNSYDIYLKLVVGLNHIPSSFTNFITILLIIFDLIARGGRKAANGQMSRKYSRRWNIQILVENMSDIRQQLISMPSARRAFSVAWPTGNQCKSLQTTHVTRFLFLSQMYFKSFSTDFTKYKYWNRSGNKTHD